MGLEPWQSWAVVVAIGGGAAWYYYGSRQPRKRAAERPHAAGGRAESRTGRPRDEGKARRRKEQPAKTSNAHDSADAMSSGVEKPSTNRQTAKPRPGKQRKEPHGTVPSRADRDRDTSRTPREEPEVDNQAFAKQMLGVKTGTSLVNPTHEGSRPRTVAPQRAEDASRRRSVHQPSGSGERSQTSSTTGGDADDDWSPARSPALGANAGDPPVSGGDVADMLEAPAPGPSVLRITPATQPSGPARPQPPPTAAAPPETKKQRQNRRKAEEKKEARAAAEAERRVLLEQQRRTAREAEGRPAKNGLGASSAPPAGPSPWASTTAATTSGASASTDHNRHDRAIEMGGAVLDQQPLLNTFDADAPPTASTHPGPDPGPSTRTSVDSSGTQASSIWDREMPSEEDQMRMLQELEDGMGWSTVLKGKKNSRKSKSLEGRTTGPETSESESKDRPGGHGADAGRPQESAKPTSMASGGGGAAAGGSGPTNGFVRPAHPADSDWAVL